MTIGRAIERADTIRQNNIDDELKLQWLSDIEGIIYNDIIVTHEGYERTPYTGIDVATDEEAVLLAADPYGALYVKYLITQYDLKLGDISRYNNDLYEFDNALRDYTDWYNRTHMPLGRVTDYTL